MFLNFFNSNKTKIKRGDLVMMKKQFKDRFPNVPSRLAMRVEDVEQDQATVIFINYNGNKICKETLPVNALSIPM